MSEKEVKRRRIAQEVMKKAWMTFKRSMLRWCTCLKISWRIIRCLATVHHSKVRGTTFENRQQILNRLRFYRESDIFLKFERERNNLYDGNAIKVIVGVKDRGTSTVGYVSRELAAQLAPIMDSGKDIIVMFDNITGTDRRGVYFGLNFSYMLI